jgi:cytochrome c556
VQVLSELRRWGGSPSSARRSGEPPRVALPEVKRSHAVLRLRFRGVSAPAVLVALASAAGLASAARGGDDSPIQRIMDQVHTRNRAIGKRLRDPTALGATDRERMAENAVTLISLGKEARGLTEPARERKKSHQDWARAADNFLREADEFAGVIADPGTSQSRAAKSYRKLQTTCTNCHNTFRGEAD